MTAQIAHWVEGSSWPGDGSRVSPVTNPATGEVVSEVRLATKEDVDVVVASSLAAAGGWASMSLSRRTRVLFAFRQLVDEHRRDLAEAITREHGKTVDDALGEVQRGLEVVEFACGIPHLLKGGFSADVSTAVDSHAIRQPLGVVAGISPFNFPIMVPMWMHPVAIACGNAFILKPSEKDPSPSILTAELWQAAGLPDGVFNVVHGDATCVDALLTHPDVQAISFVGSTPIARHVYETAATSGKRVQALGGAKNHMVVLPDADIDDAADAAVSAGYGSAGERCMAISVVVAVGDVGDRLVDAISERIAGLKVGPGDVAGTDMGPLVTREHRDRVASYVSSGLDDGAKVVVDGRDLEVDAPGDGFWLGPTLVDHVTPDMKVYRDEVFGPLLSIVRVDTLGDALDLIHDNPYGNGTAIFTRSGGAARRFASEVSAGMVGVNVPIPVPMAYYSFGGWGDSAFGDSNMHGIEGVHFFTRGKTVTSRWPTTSDGLDFSMPQSS